MTARDVQLPEIGASAVSDLVDASELRALASKLRSVVDRYHNPDRLLESIGALLADRARTRITQTKTDPDGVPWAPWSAGYARTRQPRHSLLRDSDAMLKSIQHMETDDTVAIFADTIYAGVQNSGESERNIPERRFIGLGRADIAAIEDMAADWLAQGIV